MNSGQADLVLRFRADIADLSAKMSGVRGEVQGVRDAVEHTATSWMGMVSAIGIGTLAAGAASNALGLLRDVVVDSIRAASEAENSHVRLAAILRASGNAAGASADDLEKYAAQMQQLTGVDDETVAGAEAVIAAIAGSSAQIKDATKVSLDLSAALGIDLRSAALAVAKALESPAEGLTALQRLGVRFNETEKDQIKALVDAGQAAEAQGVILEKLQAKVGGVAEEMGATTSGQLARFRADLNDLEEIVGGRLNNRLGDLVGLLDQFAKSDEAVETAKNIADAFSTIADVAIGVASAIQAVNDALSAFGGLGSVLNSIARQIPGVAPLEDLLGAASSRGASARQGAVLRSVEGGRGAGMTDAEVGQPWAGIPRQSVPLPDPATTEKANIAIGRLGASANAVADSSNIILEQQRAIAEAERLTREAENRARLDSIKAIQDEAAARAQSTVGYLQSLGQRNVRFAPGVFESIAAGGGLNLADGTKAGSSVDVVVP